MAVTSRLLTSARAAARPGRLLAWLLQASLYVIVLLSFTLVVNHGLGWAQRTLDDLRYGMPRTVQLSAVVGAGDSVANPTHFIALNIDGQISVLVLPGGDANRLVTLPGPYVIGDYGRAAVPVLSLADLTGDGAPDLLLTIRGETIVYGNQAGTFALLTPEERVRLATPTEAP
jgi:hypothetical protein